MVPVQRFGPIRKRTVSFEEARQSLAEAIALILEAHSFVVSTSSHRPSDLELSPDR